MTEAGKQALRGRLPWFRPADLTAEQRGYYDRLSSGPRDKDALTDELGRLNGACNACLLDPRAGTAIEQLGAILRFGTPALSGRQREMAIREVARFEKSGCEWRSHSRTGLAGHYRHTALALRVWRAPEH